MKKAYLKLKLTNRRTQINLEGTESRITAMLIRVFIEHPDFLKLIRRAINFIDNMPEAANKEIKELLKTHRK